MSGPLELSDSVVSVLSQYVTRRSEVGHAAFNAQLEDLLGLVELKLSEPYPAEMFARWAANPSDVVESQTLRLHLAREIDRDPDFARELTTKLGGPMPPSRRGKAKWILAAAAGVVAALAAGFLLARATGSPAPTVVAAPAPISITATTTTTVPTTTTTTETTTTTTGEPTTTTLTTDQPGTPGDGSSFSKGSPVFLINLPVPDNQWYFERGDHDVQMTQYQATLWGRLSTCGYTSREQQFRLKNYSRIEVKATGVDSTSDPGLAIKFEIFANNDNVHPLASQVANPGDAKPLAVDLPKDVFTVTLRLSLTVVDKSHCRAANAVWGSPYAVAAGS